MNDSDLPGTDGPERQQEIYRRGLESRFPDPPISAEALEHRAREVLSPEAFDYVAGGAGGEETVRANRAAFQRWRIVPRVFRDVSQRDLSVELFGQRLPAPLLLAPVGVQSILHPDAELAVARAARSLGIPMVLSTLSSYTLEAVAATLGDAPRWFQLYWPRDEALAASFVHRAEDAGFRALVVTLDTGLLGWRERDLQHAYLPFLHGAGLATYFSDPVFRAMLPVPPAEDPAGAFARFSALFSNPGLRWESLALLRKESTLPIVLKGILAPDDARRAVDLGIEGILVSNHGGRQVDGAIAALDALPEVVAAVGGRTHVLFDSGIRRGTDMLKALALGARAVLVGRPYCYGLALGGELGVREVLANLLADFDVTLALAGCAAVAELDRSNLVEAPALPPRV